MSRGDGDGSMNSNRQGFWKSGLNFPGSVQPVSPIGHQTYPNTDSRNFEMNKDGQKPKSSKAANSFQAFENSTSDAWDASDDDLLSMGNIHMSLHDVHSTARAVLDKHSRQVNNRMIAAAVCRTRSLPKAGSQDQSQSDTGVLSPANHRNSGGPGIGIRLSPQTVPNSHSVPRVPELHSTTPLHSSKEADRLARFETLLANPNINLSELRQLSWPGVPKRVRPMVWKILAGYMPSSVDRRQINLERKREEYNGYIKQYFDTRHQDLHQETFKQIRKDIPRMTCLASLLRQIATQELFERILYIWAMRHPASSYVQGINDLVTPFFVTFLSEFIPPNVEVDSCDLSSVPAEQLHIVEADTFWCLSKLLDGIQDNYTFAQPGIQHKVLALRELVKRIDSQLHNHLEKHEVEYLQFSFRWMNNLLMREIPLHCVIRLWDTYLSEMDGFATFHLYVCAAFLIHFSKDLIRESDFQGLLIMLQNLSTAHWSESEMRELLAEAYRLQFLFADSPSHLPQSTSS